MLIRIVLSTLAGVATVWALLLTAAAVLPYENSIGVQPLTVGCLLRLSLPEDSDRLPAAHLRIVDSTRSEHFGFVRRFAEAHRFRVQLVSMSEAFSYRAPGTAALAGDG